MQSLAAKQFAARLFSGKYSGNSSGNMVRQKGRDSMGKLEDLKNNITQKIKNEKAAENKALEMLTAVIDSFNSYFKQDEVFDPQPIKAEKGAYDKKTRPLPLKSQ